MQAKNWLSGRNATWFLVGDGQWVASILLYYQQINCVNCKTNLEEIFSTAEVDADDMNWPVIKFGEFLQQNQSEFKSPEIIIFYITGIYS